MSFPRQWRNRWFVFVHDLAWVAASFGLAWWLRFNLEQIPPAYIHALEKAIVLGWLAHGIVFWRVGLYRGIWRFASLPDLVRILKAVAIGAAVTYLALFIFIRLQGVPRSVIVLQPLLLAIGLAGPRILYRWWKDHRLQLPREERTPAYIVGAGAAADALVRELKTRGPYWPIGLLDDDPNKHGQELHGVRVLGPIDRLDQLLAQGDAKAVLIAIPSASRRLIRRVVEICQRHRITCRTLPSLRDLAEGRVEVRSLRRVQIEDLLGREPVELDEAGIAQFLQGKAVLITGAGGSIGSELVRQVAAKQPRRLVLVEHSEYALYRIEQELAKLAGGDVQVHGLLADVRDRARMMRIFATHRPQVVFHAAAYKHVPIIERNPLEGIKVNLLGTRVVADCAVQFEAEKFVLISTDKAVRPANVMGATKRAAELYCAWCNARAPKTAFVTTRFGNVLGSAGSVVPLFRRQIEQGGPVTVTHPEITRYFMTIPEAVGLILQAGAMGKGGEIFVLDMGEPVKIVELAEQMIRLSGLEPGRDIEIVFTGLRPGEKLYEELFHPEEELVGSAHPKLLLANNAACCDARLLQRVITAIEKAVAEEDEEAALAALRKIVPLYRCKEEQSGVNAAEVVPLYRR